MISGSLNSIAGLLGTYDTISDLPIIGNILGSLPFTGSLGSVSGSAEPIGSVANLVSKVGS